MSSQQQQQQQQQQPPPPPVVADTTSTVAAAAQQQQQSASNGSAANNNNNNNTNTPVSGQSFTPTGQPIYSQQPPIYMHYPYGAVYPAPLPNNLFVNQAMAGNVNVPAWTHNGSQFVPAAVAGPHFMHNELHSDQLGQVVQAMPLNVGHNNGSSHYMPRGRGRGRGRNGGPRRNEHNSRVYHHNQQQPQLTAQAQQNSQQSGAESPGHSAQQLHNSQEQIATQHVGNQVQSVDGSIISQPYAHYATPPALSYAGAYAPHAYYSAAAAIGPNGQPSGAGGQQVPNAGPPIYISNVPMYNGQPMYNYMPSYVYPTIMPSGEYQYLPEDPVVSQADEHQSSENNPVSLVQPIWHPAPMYDPYAVAPHLDDPNQNNASPNVLSPQYITYEGQPLQHDIQQDMSALQIYGEGELHLQQQNTRTLNETNTHSNVEATVNAASCAAVAEPIVTTWADESEDIMPLAEEEPQQQQQQQLQSPPALSAQSDVPAHVNAAEQASNVQYNEINEKFEQAEAQQPLRPYTAEFQPQQQQHNEVLQAPEAAASNMTMVQGIEAFVPKSVAAATTSYADGAVKSRARGGLQQPLLETPAHPPLKQPLLPKPQQPMQIGGGYHDQQYHQPRRQPMGHGYNQTQQLPNRRKYPENSYHSNQQSQMQQQQPPQQQYQGNANNNEQSPNNVNQSAAGGQAQTKSMSWTNSTQFKKSTASVGVTASPLPNNFGQSVRSNYARSSAAQQYNPQSTNATNSTLNNINNNNNNTNNNGGGNSGLSSANSNSNVSLNSSTGSAHQATTRNQSITKVPTSPVTANNPAQPVFERRAATNANLPAITTSTASTTAAPNQFQQPNNQTQTPTATAAGGGYAQYAAKPHLNRRSAAITTTPAAIAAAPANDTSVQPTLNLAPPAPPASQTANSQNENVQSWASLFASKKSGPANSPSFSPAAAAANSSSARSATIADTFAVTKPATPHQQQNSPAPVISPVVPMLPTGNLSYSAASAQAMPAVATATAAAASAPQNQSSTSSSALNVGAASKTEAEKSSTKVVVPVLDEQTLRFAEFLNRYKLNLTTISLRPRGLTNSSNYCYINATLQALLGCTPLYNLLRAIPKQAVAAISEKTPTVNALINFTSNFSTFVNANQRQRANNNNNNNVGANKNAIKGKEDFNGIDLQCDAAFEATEIQNLWDKDHPKDKKDIGGASRQEDAEEFLSYVLNKFNDELLEITKLIEKPKTQQNGTADALDNDDGGTEWQMICNNRNKGSVTRQTDFGRTPISDIFRGELRSRLQREGEPPTDFIQPFYTLQLNIDKVNSVREALELLVGRDQIEGVTGSKSKQEVTAWQQVTIEKLPIVLILHLKYFKYQSATAKICSKIDFPIELKIDTKILASKKTAPKQRAYRLFAVVYHDGEKSSRGHYIADVYHPGYGSWLRYDDSSVKPVSEKFVLQPLLPRVPYLLYYRRVDTLPASAISNNCVNSASFSASNK